MKRTCNECKEPINGRSDKRFCSDHCRNSYNNKMKSYFNSCVSTTNTKLRKNRSVLESLLNKEFVKVKKTTLAEKGFDFSYITQTFSNKAGVVYCFCYEYGYIKPVDPNSDYVVLLKQKNKMKSMA